MDNTSKETLTAEQVIDLRQRIGNAMATLDRESMEAREDGQLIERARLSGKREGLSLALDYLRGY